MLKGRGLDKRIIMGDTIVWILVNALAFFIGGKLLSGVEMRNFWQAVVVAIVVGLLNITFGTVLKILTLGILSFGVFTLLLDAILILVADYFLNGFKVKNFWWALGLALIVAVVNGLLKGVL